MSENPPETPSPSSGPQIPSYPAPGLDNSQISERMITLMGRTGFWVRIVSTLMFIAIIFMFIAALIAGGLVAVDSDRMNNEAIFYAVGSAIAYLVIAILYTIPALYLSRYATHAKAFARRREALSLEEALQAQKSFWKFIALFALIGIGTELIVVVIVVVVGVGTAFLRR